MIEACAHVQNQHTSERGSPAKARDLRLTYRKTTYTRDMLQDMRQWHNIMPLFEKVDETVSWLQDLPTLLKSFVPDDTFIDLEDANPNKVVKAVKSLSLVDKNAAYLQFACDRQVDDTCMSAVMWFIRQHHLDQVEFLSPHWTMFPFGSKLKDVMIKSGVFNDPLGKIFMFVVHMEVEKHWCSAVIDMQKPDVVVKVFDPLQQYVPQLKQHVKSICDALLPSLRIEIRTIQSFRDIQQLESYNCGVFSLMFLELQLHDLCGDKYDDESAATFFRYRYLAQALNT